MKNRNEEKPKSHILMKIFSIFIILFFILYLYSRYLAPYGLKVYEIPIYNKNLNSDYNGLKIAHFSDIHYGRTINEEELKNVIKELNLLNPDIVIFTGDLFDSKKLAQDNQELVTKYLKKIKAKMAKFAIIGDYDNKYLTIYNNILEDSDFILLNNSSQLIYYKSTTPINFIGLKDTKNINNLYDNKYFNITLIHEPDLIKDINNSPLVFAGHSLGGQIKLPFIDGIIKLEGANTYINSYYNVNGKDLYISNGLGTQKMSLRFLNKPSITLYRLYKK